MSRSGTVAGYFSSRTLAESAIRALLDAGFTRDEIGLAMKSREYESTNQSSTEASERREPSRWGRMKEFFGGEPSDKPSFQSEDVDTALSGLSLSDEQARYFRHRFD